ncbi:MAG: YceI family protein [Pyrinomonadaceae bacterium]|nr:YceI family protein [Pyrinomonadaceae bacterium]
MKKNSFLLSLALIGLFIFAGFSTNADNLTIAEKFADGDKIKQDEAAGNYNFDKAHSTIGFRVKHFGLVDVPGYFRDFTGTINYDAKDMKKSAVVFSAKMTSVDTGVAPRDEHLRKADFFEVEKFPDMTFKSTKVEKKGKDLLVTGDFTMKGVTKQITFPFTVVGFKKDAKGGMKMGVTAETSINRRDFGVNYGNNLPDGTPAISDNIAVVLQLECAMQKAQ